MNTVLIVDDSVTARKIVRRELERLGHTVVEACSGTQALELLSEQAPALVISDVNMGPMDGLTLLANIRRTHSAAQLPVLMLTTEAGDELKARGRALGATGWLVKPFDAQRMGAVITHVLTTHARCKRSPQP